MKRAAVLFLLGAVAAACTDESPSTPTPTVAAAAFGADVSPSQEVMPVNVVNNSNASGIAFFTYRPDGVSLDYLLSVDNIRNVNQAHIHQAARGVNGPIVAWLFPSPTSTTPGPSGAGAFDGIIAAGTITSANLVGGLAGRPLSDLVSLIQSGNAYVNVHTNDGVDPPNTGPGDFPGGEMRGQIE